MKKAFSLFLSLLIAVTIIAPTATAASTHNASQTRTECVSIDGVQLTRTTDVFDINTENEYTITTVEANGEISSYDSRTNFILLNGEKVYFTSGASRSLRASRPTTIDHDFINQIAHNWQYSYSTWVDYQFETLLNGLSALALGQLLGPLGLPFDVITLLSQYWSVQSDPVDAFWVRRYFYGNIYVVSDFATIRQIYTEEYGIIPDASDAESRMLK